jgi:hypothetical protein
VVPAVPEEAEQDLARPALEEEAAAARSSVAAGEPGLAPEVVRAAEARSAVEAAGVFFASK